MNFSLKKEFFFLKNQYNFEKKNKPNESFEDQFSKKMYERGKVAIIRHLSGANLFVISCRIVFTLKNFKNTQK